MQRVPSQKNPKKSKNFNNKKKVQKVKNSKIFKKNKKNKKLQNRKIFKEVKKFKKFRNFKKIIRIKISNSKFLTFSGWPEAII